MSLTSNNRFKSKKETRLRVAYVGSVAGLGKPHCNDRNCPLARRVGDKLISIYTLAAVQDDIITMKSNIGLST